MALYHICSGFLRHRGWFRTTGLEPPYRRALDLDATRREPLVRLGRRDEARVHWEACRHLAPADSRAQDHARLFPPVGMAVREG